MDDGSTALIEGLPSRRELGNQLDNLVIPADAKVLLNDLLGLTVNVAGRVVDVGRSILTFLLDLMKRYPGTALGALVGLTVTILIGSIPVLGVILAPLVGPLLSAFMITAGALSDLHHSAVERQITLYSAKLDAALEAR
ncbi:hypothetical protein [Qipengyuania sp. JC766]|uniref:hypothetical protein n=1 Tax=Qipengyuania sp. JC766 TaxID=3232139 RepID=UPI0034596CE6